MDEHDYASDTERTPPPHPRTAAPPAHEPANRYAFEALPTGCGWNSVLTALLRQPGQIVYHLHESVGGSKVAAVLAGIALLCLLAYGIVVGDFSGGVQLWAAPLKIAGGSLLVAAICLPSLYVLACLAGAQDKLKLGPLAGLLLAAIALSLQMMTTLRPIVGRSDRLLPVEKKFFLNHLLELFDETTRARADRQH